MLRAPLLALSGLAYMPNVIYFFKHRRLGEVPIFKDLVFLKT